MDFTGKRVLVTGSRGFIGSHLVCRLEQEGAEVIGVDISDGIDIKLTSPPPRLTPAAPISPTSPGH